MQTPRLREPSAKEHSGLRASSAISVVPAEDHSSSGLLDTSLSGGHLASPPLRPPRHHLVLEEPSIWSTHRSVTLSPSAADMFPAFGLWGAEVVLPEGHSPGAAGRPASPLNATSLVPLRQQPLWPRLVLAGRTLSYSCGIEAPAGSWPSSLPISSRPGVLTGWAS